jgi:hypothetical protein
VASLFNGTVGSLDYTGSMRWDVEGSCRYLIWGNLSASVWKDQVKSPKTVVRIASLRARNLTEDVWNTADECILCK